MRIPCKTPCGEAFIVDAGTYEDGTPALRIVTEDDPTPWCTLTVCMNLPNNSKLPPGHYIVKTWSENAETANMLLEQGIFTDTGHRVVNGYVEAEIWMLNQ